MNDPIMPPTVTLRSVPVWQGFLSAAEQATILADLRKVVQAAPLYSPVTRSGPMSVQMTSAGAFGWFADRNGYRYVDRHPSGSPWPPIPDSILRVWRVLAGCPRAPECCLVNLYRDSARSQRWGNDTAGGSDTVNGSGAAQSNPTVINVYGRVPPQTQVPPGDYSDTVTVRLEY